MSMCLLVAISIGATVAYLMDDDKVVNTFTIGNVQITLDELDVDNSTDGDNDRDQANAYHLIPGQAYVKDPTIHVAANSEDCWLFIKVENDIAAIESKETDYISIADQITDNGWTELTGVENVYYKPHAKSTTVDDVAVFGNFKISGDVEDLSPYEGKNITITAYAVQKAGFDDSAANAWAETFGKSAT